MGHETFLGLLRGEILSLFHCVYRFARKFYHRRDSLCISARAELEDFVGITILIEAGWVRPWFPGVLASDASHSGYGVAQSLWSISDVGRIPVVRRWRCGLYLLVVMPFESAGFRVDSCSGGSSP